MGESRFSAHRRDLGMSFALSCTDGGSPTTGVRSHFLDSHGLGYFQNTRAMGKIPKVLQSLFVADCISHSNDPFLIWYVPPFVSHISW